MTIFQGLPNRVLMDLMLTEPICDRRTMERLVRKLLDLRTKPALVGLHAWSPYVNYAGAQNHYGGEFIAENFNFQEAPCLFSLNGWATLFSRL